MEYTIRRTATESLYEALKSLGYYPIKTADRTSEWRRSHYHLYTLPFGKKGIKLSLHKDTWKKPAPIFTHKAENKGKDIEKEPQQIQQKYGEIIQAFFANIFEFNRASFPPLPGLASPSFHARGF